MSAAALMLIIGLGNPGAEYASTRHNAGFMAVDKIAEDWGFSDWKKKFKGVIAEGEIEGRKVILLKPQTYMNLSGESAQPLAAFYKIPVENIIVMYDELDIPLGKIKAKTGGGSAGHNGIKSLDKHVGNGFRRVRIGIGHPGDKSEVVKAVLGKFNKEEQVVIENILTAVSDSIPALIQGSDADFTTRFAVEYNR